jgi:predicted transcriptional regulator
MRYSADWMTIADERILEYLSTTETSTPKKMADSGDVRFSRQYIGERCRKLADYGMVQHLGNGVYRITDDGKKYLTGELDAEGLDNHSDR